jgi:hypothetical protein
MLLACTKKLADALKIRTVDATRFRREAFYEWHVCISDQSDHACRTKLTTDVGVN